MDTYTLDTSRSSTNPFSNRDSDESTTNSEDEAANNARNGDIRARFSDPTSHAIVVSPLSYCLNPI